MSPVNENDMILKQHLGERKIIQEVSTEKESDQKATGVNEPKLGVQMNEDADVVEQNRAKSRRCKGYS